MAFSSNRPVETMPPATVDDPQEARLTALLALYRQGAFGELLADFEAGEVVWRQADTLNLAGLAARRQGLDERAEAYYREALAKDNGHPASLNNLAILLQGSGRSDEARSLYEAALQQVPDDVLPRLNLGNLHLAAGDLELATTAYAAVLARQPTLAAAWRGMAEVLQAQGKAAAARDAMRRALAAQPTDFDALLRLADWCRSAGQEQRELLQEAADLAARAVRLQPHNVRAGCMLGELLQGLKRYAEAEFAFRAILAVDRNNPDIGNSLGILFNETKRYAESEAAYRHVLTQRPDFAEAHNNLAVLLQKLKRFAEAEPHYQRALALQPDYAAARCNYGLLCLTLGRFDEGWGHYEARYAPERTVAFPKLSRPQWQGESLAGKGILIWNEQGLGDEIQFARYAAQLKAQGARHVGLICRQPVSRLFATLAGVDSLHVEGQKFSLRPYDFWVFPLSIPRWLCPTPADIPASAAYLQADPALIARWAGKLQPGRRIGLVWRGRAEYTNDAHRSLPGLGVLAPLWALPGISFYSLQKGEGETEAATPPAGQPLRNLGAGFADFSDTAAVVAQLDLVICVDTAIAHLCGALGVPCWVMLPFVGTDWRWQLGRSDSPWYPSLRLFRQPAPEAWEAVVEALQQALRERWGGPEMLVPASSAPLSPEAEQLWSRRRALGALERRQADAWLDRQAAATGAANQAALAHWATTALEHQQAGRHDEAEAAYGMAISLAPAAAPLWHNLGALLRAAGRPDDALAAYEQAIALQGPYAEGYYNRGNLFEGRSDYAAAAADYRRAIELRPSYAEAWYNLGVVFKATGELEPAASAYRQAIALRAGYSEARNNLGMLLHEVYADSPAAEAEYRQALADKPRYAEAHNNLGVVLQERQQFLAAEAEFRQALAVRPDYPDAAWNLALMLLVTGRLLEAWPLFEQRRAITRCQTFAPPVPFPEWRGQALAGKCILVWPEQGFGDEIQFSRYFSLLKAKGAARVVVACKPPLRRLFQSLAGVDTCIEVQTGEVHVPLCDFWVFSMSLPGLFASSLANLPATQPYLAVNPENRAKFDDLPAGFKVGLLWRGSPEHPNDRNRSLPSAALLDPLGAIAGITWIDLHTAEPAGGLPTFPLLPAGRRIDDFADSAALLERLDLVITVDTAVAHLAGALGRPVWVMLPHAGLDWRWLCDRSDSPWYPQGMRLFRQETSGDWCTLLARLAENLRDFMPARPLPAPAADLPGPSSAQP